MKKQALFVVIAVLAAVLCGCVAEVPSTLSETPAESGESSAEIAVSSEPAVSEELSLPGEDSSEEELPANDPLHLDHSNILSLKYGVCALEFYDENNDFSVRYYITDEDGKYVEFHREADFVDGYMDVYFDLYPDTRRVILNNYTWEKPSDVYLYEASTGEKRQLDMSRLPRNELVTEMKWLDGRYFLFVSQFDHGTIAIGGDVWVYDTETDEYFRIIAREDGDMQISYIKVYDGMVLFTMYYYVDDDYDETETHYYALSAEEVYQLIETRSETIFCLGEWVH
ncbi:MAG: DUF4652 domain-containing protein [Clostridia bacterium]|nr:DUF4652 domain-containing protein [Clostridia bacterium]